MRTQNEAQTVKYQTKIEGSRDKGIERKRMRERERGREIGRERVTEIEKESFN